MNIIICPVRNNLHLTRKAVESFKNQDIGDVGILIINNASTDGTTEWLKTQYTVGSIYRNPPLSVAASWNLGLELTFKVGNGHALVVNNDVELRPDTYRWLVDDGGGFVTAVGAKDRERIQPPWTPPDPKMRRPHPDFSCFLIRKDVYAKVGRFDENFKIAFCEDGDYDLRLFKAGIRAYCLEIPFLHHGSMTIKNAEPDEIKRIQEQADLNRQYFVKKWGFAMGSPEYYQALEKGSPPEEPSELKSPPSSAL